LPHLLEHSAQALKQQALSLFLECAHRDDLNGPLYRDKEGSLRPRPYVANDESQTIVMLPHEV